MTAIRLAAPDDAPTVAALHAGRIAEGFLVSLGPAFLRRLYRRVIRSEHAFVLVGEDAAHRTVGFVGAAEDTGALYREFIRHDAIAAAATAAPAMARHPKRVWETLRYGISDDGDLPAAEILASAVAVGAEGRGLGRELVRAALAEFQRRGASSARVVTAASNLSAVRMYEAAGFRRRRSTEVHTGVTQEVLVWP
jgi:ribosomal protein S18 acetylase RimI-like enzyme